MKQNIKKINIFLLIWVLVILFAKFINSNSIDEMLNKKIFIALVLIIIIV